MSDEKVIELLEVLVRLTKIANFDAIKKSIESTLDNDSKKKAFILTGKKSRDEICDILSMSPSTLRDLWQDCFKKGLVKKEGRSYKPLIDLGEYGLIPEDFDIEKASGKTETKEETTAK
jgi:hypothetical protein